MDIDRFLGKKAFHTSRLIKGPEMLVAKPLSPAVLALVLANKLDASVIPATGPKGHILKGDVLNFLAKEVTSEVGSVRQIPELSVSTRKGTKYVDSPISNMRKVIASRLSESKTTIPHAYAQIDVDMTQLTRLRKCMIEEHGTKFSINDAIIKASALALKAIPEINSQYTNGKLVQMQAIDISVAVATPTGLITPIVVSADECGLLDISRTVTDLAGRAKEGKLQPHEFQGGSFSVSNLGMMGIKGFSAVINPPQACILAVGQTRPVVKVVNDQQFKILQMATFTLSSDARVCDDEEATKWLDTFKKFLENPQSML